MTTTRPPTRRAAPLLFLAVAALTGCGDDATGPEPIADTTFADALGVDLADFTELEPGGVWIRDDVVGEGTVAIDGSNVKTSYTLWTHEGSRLESGPFDFTIGAEGPDGAIPGYDMGVRGMAEGGTRTLLVPADLAYGDRVLVFEVTLDEVDALD